jgi:hypothetical protein
MSVNYKTLIPQILLSACILIVLVEYILPAGPLTAVKNELTLWLTLIGSFTFFIAGTTLVLKYSRDLIRTKKLSSVHFYAIEFLVVLFTYIGIALLTGGPSGKSYTYLYTNLQGQLMQAGWVIMAFLEPWAAYKAFQVRSLEALILAITGFTYLLFNAPSVSAAFPIIGTFANWIINVPSLAGTRGATIALAVGTILLALRMLSGKERGLTE